MMSHARHFDSGVSTSERISHFEMNWKRPNTVLVFACLLAVTVIAFAQTPDPQKSNTSTATNPQTANAGAANGRQASQLIYTTLPKTSVANLKSGESSVQEIRGKITFTLTAANYDDTVTGTLVYTIPNEARQKIAQVSEKPLNSIPASVSQKGVVASFQRGAACPVINLEIGATELDVAGVKLSFKRVVVDIIETPTQIPQLFCAWTRQINAKRQRRGIIASLNRLITVEPY
jgi:hypothetical protein